MTAHAGGAALPSDRSLLRAELRARRRALSEHERARASRQFARILRRSKLFRPGRRIAVYVARLDRATLTLALDAEKEEQAKEEEEKLIPLLPKERDAIAEMLRQGE